MLLLLPPSEGKARPPAGDPVDLDALAFAAELGDVRRTVLRAIGGGLLEAPAAPAAEVYTGVLFDRLDAGSLTAAARRRAREQLLVASGLWGLVRLDDRIPHYKLPIGEQVPRLRTGLAALWRPAVAEALASRDRDGELVVDCRSGSYAAVWRPRAAALVEVRAFRVHADGRRQVITHMAKASRGDVARELLRTRRAVRTPRHVAQVAAAAGIEAELVAPARDRGPWTLDVLEGA
ncbi:peroxide stress protein YaaA [Conexibacter sp. SYSU D00693]|uniref:peroxide stress protein YaaA n=1 Tax=Conexibacter sp. SYSU D00693 TaxID=2812560 RepID=UPI00196B9391|nr:peroxide stress protein YaaA [Conexibacter sp. SYSU D00693]